MKPILLSLFLLAGSVGTLAAPQDDRAPMSKDEVMDLLISSTPRKIIVSTIERNGIAFRPTAPILEEFRKAGADQAVLAALRAAWHEEIPKPLGDKEIRIMLAEGVPSQSIAGKIQERGIDFQPTQEYREALRSEGAQDVLMDTLRTMAPRPFSLEEIIQQLRASVDQTFVAQKLQIRGIDFQASAPNLDALRKAGAQGELLDAVRTAKLVKPFLPQSLAGPKLTAPLVEGKTASLICEPSDTDVPVFESSNDIGKIAARLRCGEQVTFLGKLAAPQGVDKIKYGSGNVGFVANSFLEPAIATAAEGVSAPIPIYKPDPEYSPEARRQGLEGSVTLSIIIDAQGNVSDARETSQPLGGGLDQKAIDGVKRWRFNPATRDGVPVPVHVMVQVSFRLYGRPH